MIELMIPYVIGFLACLFSVGAFLTMKCFWLAVDRDNWQKQAHLWASCAGASAKDAHDEQTMAIVWRDGLPILMPSEIEVKQ